MMNNSLHKIGRLCAAVNNYPASKTPNTTELDALKNFSTKNPQTDPRK